MRLSNARNALLVFTSALALYTLTAGGSLSSSDAVVTFDLTRSLVEHRSLALSGNPFGGESNKGVDGRYYSPFGIGQSIYNIPFYVLGRAAARSIPQRIGKSDTIPKAAVALGSAVAAAATVAVLWVLALVLTDDRNAAMISAASVAVGSPLWPYSKFGFSTALTALILAATALLCWVAARRGRTDAALGAGVIMAFGWLTRHELALFLVPFGAFLWIEGRRRSNRWLTLRQLAAFFVAAACGGGLWMAYNVARFGHPAAVGHVPRFSLDGYTAFLVAPAGSILLFCPIAVLWTAGLVKVARRSPGTVLLLAGPLLTAYAFYGALENWPGGRSYGPRYLVPALVLLAPGLALLVHELALKRRTAVVVVALAAVLQLPGVLVDYSKVSLDWARAAPRHDVIDRDWRITASPFILNGRHAARVVPDNIAYLSGRRPFPTAHEPAADTDRDFAQRFSFSLDFWWVYLVYLGVIGVPTALALAMSLALVAAVSAWAAWSRGDGSQSLTVE